MNTSNRILRAGDLGDEFVSWHAPEVEDLAGDSPVGPDPRLQDPVLVREQAWQEGFAQGRAEGMAAGRTDLMQRADMLDKVLGNLARPLEMLDGQLENEILLLVQAIARQLVRRELHLDPSHLIGVIREGLAALPSTSADVQVRLHPQDAAVIKGLLPAGDTGRSWSIEPDPLMEQGGCQIIAAPAQIDGRLETRLGRVVATMFEDERAARD